MNKLRKFLRKIFLKCWFSQEQIEKFYINIYWKIKRIKNPFFKFTNYFLFKIWKRSKIEYDLKSKLLNSKEVFWDNEFYQSYPPLWFDWERDTLLRFQNYNIKKYINKNTNILDIWWNIWFFSLYISKYVKHIDLVEYSQVLVDMWNILKDYENIKNVSIMQKDFKNFCTDKKYDVIFSFAVHKWIWLPFLDYIEKIYNLLNKEWILFIESQNLDIDPDFEYNLNNCQKFFKIININSTNEKKSYLRKIAIMKKV